MLFVLLAAGCLLLAPGPSNENGACSTLSDTWYLDQDADGYGDPGNVLEQQACAAPAGFVENGDDCDDDSAAVGPAGAWYADADGDGYGAGAAQAGCPPATGSASNAEDCGDDDAAIYPGSAEACDQEDNDCDGSVDEDGLVVGYADSDGDGYGDPDDEQAACELPEGYVPDASDCDDADSQSHPGAGERCDGADNDCDGDIDEEIVETWYADEDGDGFGDPGSAVDTCDPGEGYVEDDTDCDDSDARRSPAQAEVCDGVDNDCDDAIDMEDASVSDSATWYTDGDGDGYGVGASQSGCEPPALSSSAAGDCDDADAGVSPGAAELCDGVDNDCDSDTDEGVQGTFYADSDGDGFGDAGSSQLSCDPPGGYVSDDTDCDDGAAGVNPGESEVCDEVDNDCDGTADEGVQGTFYADSDGDGFGAGAAIRECEQPAGTAASGGDCEDGDGEVFPGALEICGGADEDCDGAVDEEDPDLSGAQTWYADSDGDGYGDSSSAIAACDPGDGWESAGGDCDDGDDDISPDAAEACGDGVDDNCDGSSAGCGAARTVADTSAGASRTGYPGGGGRMGETLAGVGDVNGDGYGDVLLGDPYYDDGFETWVGAAYLFRGPIYSKATASTAVLIVEGDESWASAGQSLAGGEDMDGDGLPDIAVASTGTVCVLSGLETGTSPVYSCDLSLDDDIAEIALAGDVRGTGRGTLLVSDEEDSTYQEGGGAVHLFSNQWGSASFSTAGASIYGDESAHANLRAVSGAGDLDGDGQDDIAFAGSQIGGKGRVYAFSGPLAGDLVASDADAWIDGIYDGVYRDLLGASLDGGADADGDGYADLLVGAEGCNQGQGCFFLIPGGAMTSGDVTDAASAEISSWTSTLSVGDVGAFAGDLDGDGREDVLIGDDGRGDVVDSGGAVYALLGPLSGSVELAEADGLFYGTIENSQVGSAVDGAGDTDGDGYDDFIAGAPGVDGSMGTVYLIFGEGM